MPPITALRPTASGTVARQITDLPMRGRAICRGYVTAITVPPRSAKPVFTAIVTSADDDPSAPMTRSAARVRLIWLGQRHVPGIVAGIRLQFEGMVAERDGLPTVFNPRYEILGRPETAAEPTKHRHSSRKPSP